MALLSRILPDRFVLALILAVATASILPVDGRASEILHDVATVAIAAVFFLHGGRLSRATVIEGMTNWRLHIAVLATTFVIFPVLGLAITHLLPESVLSPAIAMGLLFLCVLPSTVQSSIAFTAIAGGNVPAAVCSASASNILGMFITPAMVALLFGASGQGVSLDQVEAIVFQLLVPFIAGQVLERWIGGWLRRHRKPLGLVDRGSIVLVVYLAFSGAVVSGFWNRVGALDLAVMLVVDCLLLALVLAITMLGSRWLGFSRADRITIVFCGSKKTLASGVPMANVIFAGRDTGAILMPLMLFHQIQLMVCAVLARRYARLAEAEAEAEADAGAKGGGAAATGHNAA
ncbi:bile acid:sodium symporter [Tistrella mobilis]|jgi:sodium/bile acid cotransporter 7|uniref:bile acid:sodium symporter family protein n=1 Tax=Tistrella mobilis TaxID=171437 RepID=UPI003557FCBF